MIVIAIKLHRFELKEGVLTVLRRSKQDEMNFAN